MGVMSLKYCVEEAGVYEIILNKHNKESIHQDGQQISMIIIQVLFLNT